MCIPHARAVQMICIFPKDRFIGSDCDYSTFTNISFMSDGPIRSKSSRSFSSLVKSPVLILVLAWPRSLACAFGIF